MRPFLKRLAVKAVLLAPAAVQADPCMPDRYGGLVCGTGKDAMRVIADTTSPSKQYAFAWRSPDGIPEGDTVPDIYTVENFLVRLADGAMLAKLGGTYWETGELHANRYDVRAIWSPDSRAVIEVSNDRWNTYALAYYAVSGDSAAAFDLSAVIKPTVVKMAGKRAGGMAFRVVEERPVKLDARGRAVLTTMLYVPKEDTHIDHEVRVEVTLKDGKPAARIGGVRRVKVDF